MDLTQLQEIFEDKEPSLIVTDKEQALIRSIESVFPSSHHLLCVWQILKNIQTHFRKHFKSEDEWKLFQKPWHHLVYRKSESSYHKDFTKLSLVWNPPTSEYLLENWIPLKRRFVS